VRCFQHRPGVVGVSAGRCFGHGHRRGESAGDHSQQPGNGRDPLAVDGARQSIAFQSTDPEHYATLFFGASDTALRMLVYANCGDPAPILVRADGSAERLDSTGLVLGAFENSGFEGRTVSIAAGDRLVVFSDGVSEAREDDGAWVVDCVRLWRGVESLAMVASGSSD
jgi:serine phosphatase RsbU (regulator of sigma subunit)